MADAIDPASVTGIQPPEGWIDPASVTDVAPPVGPARGALGEIGSGFLRGALVNLPTMAGQALQYAGASSLGPRITALGQAASQMPIVQPHPEGHGAVVNALSSGAEMVAPVFAPLAAVAGAALAAPVEIPAAAIGIAGAGAGALLGAGAAGQQTLEKGEKAGVAPDAAAQAARLNAGSTLATQFGLGLVGGRVLGAFGGAISRAVGTEGGDLAGQIIGQMTGTGGVVGPALRAAAEGAALNTGIGAVQAGATAAIERNAGIDNQSPLDAALQSIPGMLGMSALLTPFGLASRALQARSAGRESAALASPDTSPEIRAQLAQRAAQGMPTDMAEAFAQNAQVAIATKQPLPITTDALLNPNAVQPPQETLALPAPQARLENQRPGQLYTFPDGSTTRDFADVENYLQNLPPGQQDAARAQIFGFEPNQRVAPSPTPEAAQQVADTVDSVHQQLVGELQANGIEPAQPMTRQEFAAANNIGGQRAVQEYRAYLADPATQEAVMRENIAKYEQMQQTPPAEAARPPVEPSTESSAPQQFNTQLSDQLGAALRQRQVDQAYTQLEAQRQSQLDAIANRTQGAELAAAAERGEVQPDANAPKQAAEISTDIAAVNSEQGFDTRRQSMAPFEKRLATLGLDQLPTHADQIAALERYLGDDTVKMSDSIRDRMDALLERWKGELPQEPVAAQNASTAPETPAQPPAAAPAGAEPPVAPLTEAPARADQLPENIPASVETQAPAAAAELPQNIPESVAAEAPAQAAALPENLTQSAQSRASDVADQVDAALASFNDRLRGGEQLSPLEQERYEDLQGFRRSLAEVTSGDNTNEAYARSIAQMAADAATKPYTESYRRYVVDEPEATDPAIMFDSIRTGRLVDTLQTIGQQGSTPEVRALANKLAGLDTGTTLKYAAPDGTGSVGEYQPATNHVNIFPGGESEQTILHESVHAATQQQITRAESMDRPRTQADAQLRKAYTEIESIRLEAARRAGADAQYGLANTHEFVAELNSNPRFQEFLKSEELNKRSLWSRAVSAIKSMLGLKGDEGTFLQRAMAVNETFFQRPDEAGFPLREGTTQDTLFRKSPQAAGKVVDEQGAKMVDLFDKAARDAAFMKMNLKTYRALLGWQTVQYIGDRLAAIPEMVSSGVAKGVQDYLAAHQLRKLASTTFAKPIEEYTGRVQKLINAAGDAAAQRALSEKMATIGGEAAVHGFDYRLNYNDNVKAGRELDPSKKEYVDQVHRDFTQLQRSNPEAAKAIEQGELLNRRTLTMTTATIARNLIDGLEPGLAAAHSKGLDFMDRAVQAARNPDTAKYDSGATATIAKNLDALFKAARELPDGTPVRSHLAELENMYRAQVRDPYFSLGRDGDYFVKVAFKDMDAATTAKLQDALRGTNKVIGNLNDSPYAFFRVDSIDQAQGLYNKLWQAGGDKIDGPGSAFGLLADKSMVNSLGATPALRQLLTTLHETVDKSGVTGEAADAMRQTLTRSLLSMLPETSARSAKMQQRGIPGYDADFLRNYAKRASGSIMDTSNIYAQRSFDAALDGIRNGVDTLNRTGSVDGRVRAQMAADEINKRFMNDRTPMGNNTVNLINSFGHAFYLALSPAYLIRTTAQPLHRGLPLLGARYGMVNSAKEIGRATPMALKVMANTIRDGYQQDGIRGVLDANTSFKNIGLSPKEEAFVQELHDRGVLNLGQTRAIQNMAMGGTQRQQDVARIAAMTAQYAEMTNRLAVGLAAFRLAEKGTKNVTQRGTEANTDYAVQAIDRVMDNFDPSNTARSISKYGFAGKVTPLITAFMNYNLQTMQQIARTVHDGFINEITKTDTSPAGLQRGAEARKEFAGLMATTFMISGALGLPFANAFAGAYNTLADLFDKNDPRDIRIDAQNFLANTLGHTAGDVIAHGLPRAANFDSSTFGLENLLPGSEFLSSRRLFSDRVNDLSQTLTGPALNAGIGIVQAADKLRDGYYMKAIESSLPSGLKPYFKAYELYTRGYTDSKENPIPLKANGWDVGLQVAGFHTGSRATELEAQGFNSARQDRLNYQRGLIQDRFYKAATNNDEGARQAASEDLQAFNAANPTQAIRNVSGGIRQRIMELALGQALGVGMPVSRAELPSVAANLAFARANQE